MKVIKEKSEFGLNIYLKEDGKCIAFTFRENGDLYWSIRSKRDCRSEEGNYDYFIITKENYAIYSLFEKLFFDIENINIFDEERIAFYFESEEEKQEYVRRKKKENEENKIRYRLFNRSNYNELFNGDKKTITWYSDETAHEVANILKIKKEEDIFRIEFYVQPHIKGYDKDFHLLGYIPIRFRNFGSSYEPFNVIFMRMYHNIQEIDDVNDIGHQMHIEEYLYNRELVKQLKR